MKIKLLLISSSLLGTIATSADVNHRCAKDNLSIPQSEGRVHWSKRRASSDKIREWGGGEAYIIDSSWIQIKSQENIKYPDPKMRRTEYPTYGVSQGSNLFSYPNDWKAPTTGNAPLSIPANYVVSAWCIASCYKPEMKILLDSGYMDIKTAMDLSQKFNIKKRVMVLDDNASLDSLLYRKADISGFNISFEDYNHDIVYLKMESGTELRVTPNHTFLNHEGKLYLASEYQEGDKIMTMSGVSSKISSIEIKKWKGKVLNLTPKGSSQESQILSVEGFLTGSAYYQSVKLTDLNRYTLRRNINI